MGGNEGDSESTFFQDFKNINEKIRFRGVRKLSFRLKRWKSVGLGRNSSTGRLDDQKPGQKLKIPV